VAAFSPAVAEHKLGIALRVLILNTNPAGATDFAPNTLSAMPITRLGGAALQPGDLLAGAFVTLAYDGTQYQIISPLGGTTAKAPKLIGFAANQAGASATSVPTSVGTVVAFGNIFKNNLWGTSTFTSGTTLTIGAGEAGIWDINAAIHVPVQSSGAFEQIAIFQNGTQVFTGTTTTSTAGGGSYVEVSANIVCAVGDVIRIEFYHQYGITISTANDQTTNFSACLIST
jgi:hypothetical protein